MTANKKYAPAQDYEKKLERVMKRLEAQEYDFDWGRHAAWVKFLYKGNWYQFEYTLEMARAKGKTLSFGSDCFAKIVLTLERLALMVEVGIYDLQRWVKDMKLLPQAVEFPSFLKYMGFVENPKSAEEVKQKFRDMSKIMHPDAGGCPEDFQKLDEAYRQALAYMGGKE